MHSEISVRGCLNDCSPPPGNSQVTHLGEKYLVIEGLHAGVVALAPPEPHGHDGGDADDEPHQVEDDDEGDEVDGRVGHGPESEVDEEEDGGDEEAEEGEGVAGDPGDAEAALVALDGLALGGVRVGEGDVEGEAVEGEVEAAEGEDQVDVGAVEAADDQAHQPEQDQQAQQGELWMEGSIVNLDSVILGLIHAKLFRECTVYTYWARNYYFPWVA